MPLASKAEATVSTAIAPDGTRVLAWSATAGARLWDTNTLTPLSLPLQHLERITGAAFFDDGEGIVTSDQPDPRLIEHAPDERVAAGDALGQLLRRIQGRVRRTAEALAHVLDRHVQLGIAQVVAHQQQIDVAACRVLALGDRAVDERRPDARSQRSQCGTQRLGKSHGLLRDGAPLGEDR